MNRDDQKRLMREWILSSFKEWYELFGRAPVAAEWNLATARATGRADYVQQYEATGRSWPPIRSVMNHFGSWSAGIEAAGLEALGQGQYRDESTRGACHGHRGVGPTRQARWDRIAELWHVGLVGREIALELGCTEGSVWWELRHMREAGMDLPPRRPGPQSGS